MAAGSLLPPSVVFVLAILGGIPVLLNIHITWLFQVHNV